MKASKHIFLKSIYKQPVERTPVWIMRQAGRYLPEYMEIRKKHKFLEVCKTPELAAEVTLQPLRRFGFDAAILFSDILVIPEAMGQKLTFEENHGPLLSPAIVDIKSAGLLNDTDLEIKLGYVGEAIRLINKKLDDQVPLIGFSGSPFTLATYMIEGSASKNFKNLKRWIYSSPETFLDFMDILSHAVIRYLKLQIDAGVQAIQIFDTWGTILPLHIYHHFSGQFLSKIVEQLQPTGVPIILFMRGGLDYQRILVSYKPDALSLDWTIDIREAYESLYDRAALQGNLDPTVLYGSKKEIEREVMRILKVFENKSGHIFNLGHGILPDIPLDNVTFLVETVKNRSIELHTKEQ
jgi:uroporphyrinogen decarboxylase